jgi:hypothetical protein
MVQILKIISVKLLLSLGSTGFLLLWIRKCCLNFEDDQHVRVDDTKDFVQVLR